MSLPNNLQARHGGLLSLLSPLMAACILPNPGYQDDTGATSGPTAASETADTSTAGDHETTATTAMTETTTETVTSGG